MRRAPGDRSHQEERQSEVGDPDHRTDLSGRGRGGRHGNRAGALAPPHAGGAISKAEHTSFASTHAKLPVAPDSTAPADLPFRAAVEALVRSVPPGRVTSYGAVAALVGSPRAARGVGAALNALPADTDVPWWRVANRSGELTIPAELGLRALQRTLLLREGVEFLDDGRVDLEKYEWDGGS